MPWVLGAGAVTAVGVGAATPSRFGKASKNAPASIGLIRSASANHPTPLRPRVFARTPHTHAKPK